MTAAERELVLAELRGSEARLVGLVEGLTAEQWGFRESAERWSIAENLEHVVAFEVFLRGVIAKTMAGEPEPGKSVAEKDSLVFGIATGRDTKFNAREVVRPVGRWAVSELVAEFKKTRAETMVFAAEIDGDLRGHFFAHVALGDLDCYQWLVVLGQHGSRHAAQIEQVMADAHYPR